MILNWISLARRALGASAAGRRVFDGFVVELGERFADDLQRVVRHPHRMRATILVTASPHFGVADAEGTFRFEGVVPGAYKLIGFVDGKRVEKTVDVTGSRAALSVR